MEGTTADTTSGMSVTETIVLPPTLLPKIQHDSNRGESRHEGIQREKPPQVAWFAVATHFNDNVLRLRKLFEWNKVELHIVGLGDKRVQETGWRFGYKLILLQEFLSSPEIVRKYGDDDLLICIDSGDALPNWGRGFTEEMRREMIRKYREMESDIVFSAQWLASCAFHDYQPQDICKKRFAGICSSMFIGTFRALRWYISHPELKFDTFTDDEAWWRYRYHAQWDARWNRFPHLAGVRKYKKLAQGGYDAIMDVIVAEDKAQGRKHKQPGFPSPRIVLDTDAILFHNMVMDVPEWFTCWSTDPVSGALIYTDKPRKPMLRAMFEKMFNGGLFPPRHDYELPRTARTTRPYLVHLAAYTKVVGLPKISQMIMRAQGLDNDNLDTAQGKNLVIGGLCVLAGLLAVVAIAFIVKFVRVKKQLRSCAKLGDKQ